MEFVRREVWWPWISFASLFGPIIGGVAAGIAVPFALFTPPIGWVYIALMLADYAIPLRTRPWTRYFDMWVTRQAASFQAYFPTCKVHVDPDFKICKDRRYLLCGHPHGIFGFYLVLVLDHVLQVQGVRVTSFAAGVLTLLPFARRHFSWVGVTSADAKSMRKNMQGDYPHNVCYTTPGGVEEMFCVPDEQIVVLKRKGFCKIALQSGTDLVPIYGFGNNQMFPVKSGPDSFLAKVSKKLNVTIMLWLGRFNIPYSLVATKHPQLLVIGAPIKVEQRKDPSQEEIEALHKQYCVAMRQLFDKHKTDHALSGTGFADQTLLFEDEKKSK